MKKLFLLLFLLIVVITVGIYYPYKTINKDLIKNNVVAPELLKIVKVENKPNITVEELENISDTSSEHNGKWAGLCEKNSINSSNTGDPLIAFKNTVMSDPVLVQHFDNFMWSRASVTTLDNIITNQAIKATVTHRSGATIKPTKKEIKLKGNDEVITDGYRVVRTFCCNDVLVKVPLPPIEKPPEVVKIPPTYTTVEQSEPVIDTPITDAPSGLPFAHFTPIAYPVITGGRYIDKPPQPPPTAPVPEPGTLLLFGTGLITLTFLKRKLNRRKT